MIINEINIWMKRAWKYDINNVFSQTILLALVSSLFLFPGTNYWFSSFSLSSDNANGAEKNMCHLHRVLQINVFVVARFGFILWLDLLIL